MSARPRVYSIPAGAPFLAVLADALLAGRLGALADPAVDPLALADVTILLPTRRATRALREAIADRLGEAAILPRIATIADVDEEGQLLDPAVGAGDDPLALPPPVSRLARQLTLTRLILAWGKAVRGGMLALRADEPLLIPASATDATRLAADLARLIDDMAMEGKSLADIARLVRDDQTGYFQITLDFLKIAFEAWPQHLAEAGLADPVRRRDDLIRAEARRLAAGPPRGLVIAAGSTGSIPATAELLSAIARLPNGAVVLPGLDHDLDAAGWAAIGADGADGAATNGHPQYGLKKLIGLLGVDRPEVEDLGVPPPALAARARLLSEAMRPAETTESWSRFRAAGPGGRIDEAAMAGVSLLVGHNEQEEATAIAIAIREAIEEGARTVAVMTPDRSIARRVAVELRRWQLDVDDSAGATLDRTPEGVFARLVAEAAVGDGDPVTLLAMAKHPFAGFGMDRVECRRAARMLELALFRGVRVPGGIAALRPAIARARPRAGEEAPRHGPASRRRLSPGDWALAERLAARIEAALLPVEALFGASGEASASAAATVLLDALRAAATDEKRADGLLWQGDAGERLAELLAGVAEDGGDLALRAADLPGFLAALMGEVAIGRQPGADPRVHIWGTLEARLQSVDLAILAGLDESVWPAATRTDAWLSRAMRGDIGLPPPERRIGLAAHDFAEGFATEKVIVTRAEKRGGAPTVASRWLQRLAAFLGKDAWTRLRQRGDRLVALARHIDRVEARAVRPVARPEPKPPVAARPRRLAITEIETLVRDPYATYARRVLALEELDPLGRAPDAAKKGSLIHEALGRFAAEWAGPFDEEARRRLIEVGRETLAEIAEFPDVHAIWSIRFAAIARWVVGWEARRAVEIARRNAEISGEIEIAGPAGPFKLYGRADRIDLRTDGALEILDFKTGTPPSAPQVRVGFSPQLALEAMMARAGAFDPDFAGRSIARLDWIGLGKVDRGEPVSSAVEKGWTADALAGVAEEQIAALVKAFDDPAHGYRSWARPQFQTRYESPYDHLARVREWGLVWSEEDLEWPAPV